ncbi:MAG: nucleotidyltransferase family protein [Candidatus Omnitrophica bacterium]|nr:nucleotidyltransferase family protein [Candidatus Omnitrophota bacterium]
MKALILAGGRGKRLGRLSGHINKCMLKVRGKPLIEYSLSCISELEQINQIIIVVGYRPEDIINKYGNKYKGKNIQYVLQRRQGGLVHAIECAKSALEKDDFMLMLGDEFMVNPHHREFMQEFNRGEAFALCGVVSVLDKELIKKTYSVIEAQDKQIFRLIEKPRNPFSSIMGTGNCIFKNSILGYIPEVPINQKRKEKELPDLIQCAIDDGNIVKSFLICREYINVNSQEELDKTISYFAHL